MANGVCIHELAKNVVHRGFEAYVICYSRKGEPKNEIIDGVYVTRLSMPLHIKIQEYSENVKISSIKKILLKYARFSALLWKLIHYREYPLRDMNLVRGMVKECTDLIRTGRIGTVVASYTPMEAIKAGAKLKQIFPDLKTVYYSLDTLSNESGTGVLPKFMRSSNGQKRELNYFHLYDKVVLMNCHKHHYQAGHFMEFANKIIYVDFPLFQPKNSQECYVKDPKTIVYAGSLYRVIRNPGPVLEALTPILNEYTIHFYGPSDCDDILDKYNEKFPGHVLKHGQVPYLEAQMALDNAAILLSIGNVGTEMSPSKIYEYVSKGKPIIHGYGDDRDFCLPILKKYGNALCIDIRINNNLRLTDFLNNAKQLRFNEDTPLFKFSRASYTIDQIYQT